MCGQQSVAILDSCGTQSLNWRVRLARELSQYLFRVSRLLVKRVQWCQEIKIHVSFLFICSRFMSEIKSKCDEYFNCVMKPAHEKCER